MLHHDNKTPLTSAMIAGQKPSDVIEVPIAVLGMACLTDREFRIPSIHFEHSKYRTQILFHDLNLQYLDSVLLGRTMVYFNCCWGILLHPTG